MIDECLCFQCILQYLQYDDTEARSNNILKTRVAENLKVKYSVSQKSFNPAGGQTFYRQLLMTLLQGDRDSKILTERKKSCHKVTARERTKTFPVVICSTSARTGFASIKVIRWIALYKSHLYSWRAITI